MENETRARWTRRGFLACAVASLASDARAGEMRSLWFEDAQRGDQIDLVYRRGGDLDPEAHWRLSVFLRDDYTGEHMPIDPVLLDLLWALQRGGGRSAAFVVFSGFRSKRTNDRLRGAAPGSLHMVGKAIDLRPKSGSLKALRRDALTKGAGGVGYYPQSGFVHLDTGAPRSWTR